MSEILTGIGWEQFIFASHSVSKICHMSGVSAGMAEPFPSHALIATDGKFRLVHMLAAFQEGESKSCKVSQDLGLEQTEHNVHSILLVKQITNPAQI